MAHALNLVNPDRPKRVLMVISNPATSTTLGVPVGFWGSELTHAYKEFRDAGYAVTVASPDGGACRLDAWSDPRDPSKYSAEDLITMGFIHTPELWALVEHTPALQDLALDGFDAIVAVGGQGPMFTFRDHRGLQAAIRTFYESGRVTAALCHGVAILRYARLSNGEPLVKGKTVTGFANVEEDFADEAVWSTGALPRDKHVMPWRIEDELKRLGANYIQAGLWKGFAIRDGNLVTGQQNFSGGETAEVIIRALGE